MAQSGILCGTSGPGFRCASSGLLCRPSREGAMPADKSSVVLCPNCKLPMKPGEPKPILFAKGLVDIPYRCEKCSAQTTRTMTRKIEGAAG
jgi:hypothetical protein